MGLREELREARDRVPEPIHNSQPELKINTEVLEKDIYDTLINIDNPVDQRQILMNVNKMIVDYYQQKLEQTSENHIKAQRNLERFAGEIDHRH